MTWLDRIHAAVPDDDRGMFKALSILVAAVTVAESDGIDIDDLLDRQMFNVPRLETEVG